MKKILKTTLIILASIAVVCAFCFIGAYMIAPGSYPYAEHYPLPNIDIEQSIEMVASFKEENQQFGFPQMTGSGHNVGFKDGGRYPEGYWYTVYFYDKECDLIFLTWLRQYNSLYGEPTTILGLVRVKDGGDLERGWRTINCYQSLPVLKNRKVKKIFESRILVPFKEHIERERFSQQK